MPNGTASGVFAFHTFGCKANQYDTERMRQEIEARGGETVRASADADVLVVNTCTVTNQADADARRYIRRARRERPDLEIVVVGCSAALRAREYASMPEVSTVVPGHDPLDVAAAAARVRGPLVRIDVARSSARVDRERMGAGILLRRRDATRGWLKIQDGCDRKCSFCATRLARGTSRSRPVPELVREATALFQVHPELVLTGIHIGHYGRDLTPAVPLSGLVARLLEEVPDVRFRLGSIEATEVDDPLLDLLSDSDGRVAPHLHMPLQSGADPVLRKMRRWHTREMYRARALEIAERVPVLGLGADIITGFPGERDADHRRTVELVEELPYTYLHVFPFSPREGTDAALAGLQSPVPQRVAGERSRELRETAQRKGRAYRRSRAGAWEDVVLEGKGHTALTGDYLRVSVTGPPGGHATPGRAEPASDPGTSAPPALVGDGPGSAGLRRGRLAWRGTDLAIDLTPVPPFN